MSCDHVDGFGATHRQTNDAGAIQFQELQESKHIFGRRVRDGRCIRLAIAADIEAYYCVIARKVLDLGVPHPAVRESGVQKHQRSAMAVEPLPSRSP